MAFSRRANMRRGSKIRRPQRRPSNPISAPRRTTFHSKLPQGWGLRSRNRSPSCRSGNMPGIITRGGIMTAKDPPMFFDLNLPTLIARIFVLLTAFAVHEFSHPWTPDRVGGPNPRTGGRLTVHPSAPLLMAAIAAIPFQLGLVSAVAVFTSPGQVLPTLDKLLYEFVYINLILMLFNLIPLAPLDGEKIAYYFFPPSWARFLDTIRPYGPMILLALIFLGSFVGFNLLGVILGPPLQALLRLLVG